MGAALPVPLQLAHPRLPELHLRRLRPSDAAAFHAAVTTPEIGRMLFMFPADWTLSAAEAYLRDLAPRQTAPFRLAIDAGDGVFLGSIGLVADDPAELAFFLVPEAKGQGIIQAALTGFVDMVFARFSIPVLQARVYHDNPASMVVLRRAGFIETGTTIGTCSAQRSGAEKLHNFMLTRA